MNKNKYTPAIILVKPQLGQNIGAVARAMLNCGLVDLRLVAPRDGWPNADAIPTASGAFDLMDEVHVFDTTAQAVADCHSVFATSARLRDMEKPVLAPEEACKLAKKHATTQKTAFLFGCERAGLDNDDISLSHGLINIPLNPDFSSFNLAQAVLVISYVYSTTRTGTSKEPENTASALHKDQQFLIDRLFSTLEEKHFFRDEGLKPTMKRNIQNFMLRALLTEGEISIFQGMISALIGKKTPKPKK